MRNPDQQHALEVCMMRIFTSIFIFSLGMTNSASCAAREASLLDFSIRPTAIGEFAGNLAPAYSSEIVARSMSAEFTQSGFGAADLLGADKNIDCDDIRYTPTWWLPRAAEARRALHFSAIARVACEYGLPTRLLDAVIAQESGYNPWVVSSAGAMGMMQIMPGTARTLGLESPFDAVANMRAGARYLRQQIDRFGRIDLALAAYNAGPERRSLQRGVIPAIPETLTYVRTITKNWVRLASIEPTDMASVARASAAILAVRTAGYRDVELSVYDDINNANPI